MYNDISADDWLNYSQYTKRLCEWSHLADDDIVDVYDLNRLWDDFQRSIHNAANTYIKSK